MNTALQFIEVAEKDLKASRVLHSEGLYSQAVFSLQQSVEKSHKAMLVFLDPQTTFAQLRDDVRHDPLKVYERLIRKQATFLKQLRKRITQFGPLHGAFGINEADLDEAGGTATRLLQQIASVRKAEQDLLRLGKRDAFQIEKGLRLNRKRIDQSRREAAEFQLTEEDWKDALAHMDRIIRAVAGPAYEQAKAEMDKALAPLNKEILEEILKNYLLPIALLVPISEMMYLLAILTLPHAVASRYPDETRPLTAFYGPRRPLVKALPVFIGEQDYVLSALKELIGRFQKEVH